MDNENVVTICGTIVVLAFLGFMYSMIAGDTDRFNTCIKAGGSWNNGRIEGCGGHTISFCFDAKSSNSNAILVVSSNNNVTTPGSTLTTTHPFTDSVRTCFNWSPSLIDTGLRILTFTIKLDLFLFHIFFKSFPINFMSVFHKGFI